MSFPALLFTGVPPVPANATNTLALWVGTTASGGAYPQKLNLPRRIMIPLVVTSVAARLAGAFLLIKTPAQMFLRVLPWLLLGATLLFAFGKHVTGRTSMGISHDASTAAVTGASIFEFMVAIYGGYFGGGVGIMNLAMLAALGMADIHAMNKLKVILGGVINGVATLTFIATGMILWPRNAYVYCHGNDSMAAGNCDDRRRNPRWLFQRALCAEVATGVGARLCHFGGDRHDDLLFHPRLSLEATEECAKHIDFLLSVTTFDIVRLL